MRYVAVGFALVVAALVATFMRYGSINPCEWLIVDTAHLRGLPLIVAETRVRAGFLVGGTTDPGYAQCLTAWWDLRAAGASAETN